MTHRELMAKQTEQLEQGETLLAKMRELIKEAHHIGKQEGLQSGYDLGWHYRQVENSNRALIKERGKK